MAKRTKRKGGHGKYEIAGRTRDGVILLEPIIGPTSFTKEQCREVVRRVMEEHDESLRLAAPDGISEG